MVDSGKLQLMGHRSPIWGTRMRDKLYTLYFRLQDLARGESGQDLVEYALIVAMIAFAATAGMSSLANAIDAAFSGISSSLGSYTN